MARKSQKTQNKRRNIDALPQDFESVAKRLGADESKERFEAELGKIARANRFTGMTIEQAVATIQAEGNAKRGKIAKAKPSPAKSK